MYYSSEKNKITTREELKRLYNAIIPINAEEYQGWYFLHEGTKPSPSYTQKVVSGPVENVDGQYTQTYVLEDKDENELTTETRSIRNRYLRLYVDPSANNTLKWEDLSQEDKTLISNYRRYLLDYPQQDTEWWKEQPLTFEEWKEL